jgi:hypothetical protein
MTRVFLTRPFSRFIKKAGIPDQSLWDAVQEMRQGLIDADLGGHVLKRRVALLGRGKRGGARTIVATRMEDHWFFLYGFSKNERSNIDKHELKALQELARELLEFDRSQLSDALSAGEIVEIHDGNNKA